MLSQDEFTTLYSQYQDWYSSQSSQTDAYEFEKSFDAFLHRLGKDIFEQTVSAPAETSARSKKKSSANMANTLDKHHQRIIEVIKSKIRNTVLEGFNAKVQTMKKKVRGYKKVNNFIPLVKLHCQKQLT